MKAGTGRARSARPTNIVVRTQHLFASRTGLGRRPARTGRAAFVALALIVLPWSALAGTTGRLAGRVVDAKKQPLAGVNLAVPAARTGAVADADGRYSILNIPAA